MDPGTGTAGPGGSGRGRGRGRGRGASGPGSDAALSMLLGGGGRGGGRGRGRGGSGGGGDAGRGGHGTSVLSAFAGASLRGDTGTTPRTASNSARGATKAASRAAKVPTLPRKRALAAGAGAGGDGPRPAITARTPTMATDDDPAGDEEDPSDDSASSHGRGRSGAAAAAASAVADEEEPCCPVCIEDVLRRQRCWACAECRVVYHLTCIQSWATNAMRPTNKLLAAVMDIPNVWHCPSCRHEFKERDYPEHYRCWCGGTIDPADDPWQHPHSCGEPCGRPLGCAHSCTQLCHPGACPPCPQSVRATCYCGEHTTMKRCGQELYSCGAVCDSPLPCGHDCAVTCHPDECPPCTKSGTFTCKCGRSTRDCPCSESEWSCGEVCGRPFACGHHSCERVCHDGPCGACPRAGARACPCGKVTSELPCTEDVPRCGNTCGKTMACGEHTCPEKCHEGDCGDCHVLVEKTCVCGRAHKARRCFEPLHCTVKCPNTRNCGRHACKRRCCPGDCEPCHEVCGRMLPCGNHRCRAFCHIGDCETCPVRVEVTCACGTAVTVVPCGFEKKVDPPQCTMRCRVTPECHHTVRQFHTCHFGDCPPCSQPCGLPLPRCDHTCGAACHHPDACAPCGELVERSCVGGHEVKQVRCSEPALFRCDRDCGRPLSCGNHMCTRRCHAPTLAAASAGAAAAAGAGTGLHAAASIAGTSVPDDACGACDQRCSKPRTSPSCPHPCDRACHAGDCAPCDVVERRQCQCGSTLLEIPCPALRTAASGYELPETTAGARSRRLGADAPTALAKLLCCGGRCHAPLPNCAHKCRADCHVGPCPGADHCDKPVMTRCRCGTRKAEWPCHEAQAARAAMVPPRNDVGFVKLLPCDADCPPPSGSADAGSSGDDGGGSDSDDGGAGAGNGMKRAADDPRFAGMSKQQIRSVLRQERREAEHAALEARRNTWSRWARRTVSPGCVAVWVLKLLAVVAAAVIVAMWALQLWSVYGPASFR